MLAGPQRGARHVEMEAVGRGDVHDLHSRIGEHLVERRVGFRQPQFGRRADGDSSDVAPRMPTTGTPSRCNASTCTGPMNPAPMTAAPMSYMMRLLRCALSGDQRRERRRRGWLKLNSSVYAVLCPKLRDMLSASHLFLRNPATAQEVEAHGDALQGWIGFAVLFDQVPLDAGPFCRGEDRVPVNDAVAYLGVLRAGSRFGLLFQVEQRQAARVAPDVRGRGPCPHPG